MIDNKFALFLKDHLKWAGLISFVSIMLFAGFIINIFEKYKGFEVLAPILLLMMALTICVLKIVYKNITDFKENYEEKEMFKKSFHPLFNAGNRGLIYALFALMIFIYFVCLYQLHFVSFNIMGCYTLFLGGGTFLFALMGYELHIRLAICLRHLEKQCCGSNLKYNTNSPKDTSWLTDLYKLSKLLRISSFILGLLFVFENALFFLVNMGANSINDGSETASYSLSTLPLELWIIWIFIFLAITLALPIIALTQIQSLHSIVLDIKKDFTNKVITHDLNWALSQDAIHFLALLLTVHIVEKSLYETFLLKKGEKIIAVSTSILTILVHVLTFANFIST